MSDIRPEGHKSQGFKQGSGGQRGGGVWVVEAYKCVTSLIKRVQKPKSFHIE